MASIGAARAFSAIAPRVIVYAGAEANAVRTHLVAEAGRALLTPSHQHAVVTARSCEENLADELRQLLEQAYQSTGGRSPIVPLVIVVGPDEPLATKPSVERALKAIGTSFHVRPFWLRAGPPGTCGFNLAPVFLNKTIDRDQSAEDLFLLAASFSLTLPSRMREDGFDAFREAANGSWQVSLEVKHIPDLQSRAMTAVDAALRTHFYPALSGAVLRELRNHPHFIADLKIRTMKEFAARQLGADLPNLLRKLCASLSDRCEPGTQPLPDVESLLQVYPVPLFGFSQQFDDWLNLYAPKDAIRAEHSNLVDSVSRKMLLSTFSQLEEEHLIWATPNASLAQRRKEFAGAFGLVAEPSELRTFSFLPSSIATDDRHEQWLLPDTCAYLNFVQ